MDAPPPSPTAAATTAPKPPQNPTQPPERPTKEPPNKITTIQSARISVTSSPATAATENRKNRKRPLRLTNEEDDQDLRTVNDLVGTSLVPSITSIEVPEEAIQPPPTTPLAPIVHYPSSGPMYSLSPYVLPPISGEGSPTPLATPTRYSQGHANSLTHQSTPDDDIPMIFANLTPQEDCMQREHHTPPSPAMGTGRPTASVRGLVEADRTDPNVRGANPLAIVDKFTPGPMPQVQDAHPTSIFKYLDLDLISDWENFQ
ncbi:hypothetical protein H4582DRAFT_2081749 [Lactarius indigo]|nr:hypothetical protein H4582DRAFT_2081749 [Lactarius indigo]